VDLTPQHLLVRGDHLPDYSRIGAHADALEAYLERVAEAEEQARADRNLTAEGVRGRRAAAATAALELVRSETSALAAVLDKEAERATANPFVLARLDGVDPEEAAAQRRHAVDLFLAAAGRQPEERRDIWIEQQLLEAAGPSDRRALLAGVYELAHDLGAASGIPLELVERVQERHRLSRDREGVETRDARRAAAQLVRANAAKATRELREMGAEPPQPGVS